MRAETAVSPDLQRNRHTAGGTAADTNGERSWLDDPLQVAIVETQLARSERELDLPALPSLQRNPAERFPLLNRRRHAANEIRDVDLHHLITVPAAGVLHRQRERCR